MHPHKKNFPGEARLIFFKHAEVQQPVPSDSENGESLSGGKNAAHQEIERQKEECARRVSRLKSIYEKHRAENPEQWDTYWQGFREKHNSRLQEWNTYTGSMTAVLDHIDSVLDGYEAKLLPLENSQDRKKKDPASGEKESKNERVPSVEEQEVFDKQYEALKNRVRRMKKVYDEAKVSNPAQWDEYWQTFRTKFMEKLAEKKHAPLTQVSQGLTKLVEGYEKKLLPLERKNIPANWHVKTNQAEIHTWVETTKPFMEQQDPLYRLLPSQLMKKMEEARLPMEKEKVIDDRNPQVFLTLGKDRWSLSTPRASWNYWAALLRSEKNPDVQILIDIDDLLKGSVAQTLNEAARKAIKHYESEQRDDAGIKKVEISKGEPVGYVELADLSDSLIKRETAGARNFSQILGTRYDIVSPPGEKTLDMSKQGIDPNLILHAHIQKIHSRCLRNFFINVITHGSTKGFHFGKNMLYPEDIKNLFLRFPDCKFTLNTIAFYGGGMGKAFEHFQDRAKAPKGRVTVFTQTKGDVVNYSTKFSKDIQDKVQSAEELNSTKYTAALMHYLVHGKDGRRLTYGEAHLLADRHAKRMQYTDASGYSSNPNAPPSHTAENEPRLPADKEEKESGNT